MRNYLICFVVSLFFITLPPALAGYYVVLDSSLPSLLEPANGVAEIHNGTLIMVNISRSNLTFLGDDDTVLFVVNGSKFDGELVYSLYKKLDRDGDGIYDPVVGFLPVDNYARFRGWANSLVRTYKNRNSRALFVCPSCSPEMGLNGSVYYLYGGYATYENYFKYSKNVSSIWIAGHGDPSGVDLLYWRFDEHHMGDAEGKAFIFESCSVGMTWLTADPIALSLLGNGSPAIVASIDAGGVSYFPPEYWTSNHTLGKLAQINNAYFMKIGIPPKVVVLGDPACEPGQNSNYFKRIPHSDLNPLGRMILPEINGYAYVPKDPFLSMLLEFISPLNFWRGIVTEGGIFALLVAIGIVLIGSNMPGLKKRDLVPGLVSPIGAIALLSFTLEDISPEVVFKIYLSWALMVLATYRKHSLFIFLLTPILLFIAFSAMAGLISVKYSLFLLVTGMIGTFILWLLLKLNLLLVKKFEQQ